MGDVALIAWFVILYWIAGLIFPSLGLFGKGIVAFFATSLTYAVVRTIADIIRPEDKNAGLFVRGKKEQLAKSADDDKPTRKPSIIGARITSDTSGKDRSTPLTDQDWRGFVVKYRDEARGYIKQAQAFSRIKDNKLTRADLDHAEQTYAEVRAWLKRFESEYYTIYLDSDADIRRKENLYEKVFDADGEISGALADIRHEIEWQEDPENPDNIRRSGYEFEIEYLDDDGTVTTQRIGSIKPVGEQNAHNSSLIEAYCSIKESRRYFDTNRIKECTNLLTFRRIKDLRAYLRRTQGW